MLKKGKYTDWYFAIIAKSRIENRKKHKRSSPDFVYYERHHVIPLSMGGANTKDNLVLLTAKEHYICHRLLCEITTGIFRRKMINAFIKMCYSKSNGQERHTPRSFDNIRRLIAEKNSNMFKGVPKSKQMRERLSKSRLGMKFSKEHRANLSRAFTGRKNSQQYKDNMSRLKGAKTISLVSPNGIIYSFENMKSFCREHNLDRSTIIKVVNQKRKQYKGWKLYVVAP